MAATKPIKQKTVIEKPKPLFGADAIKAYDEKMKLLKESEKTPEIREHEEKIKKEQAEITALLRLERLQEIAL